MKEIVDLEIELSSHDLSSISKELLLKAKESGFSDSLLADLLGSTLEAVTELRKVTTFSRNSDWLTPVLASLRPTPLLLFLLWFRK